MAATNGELAAVLAVCTLLVLAAYAMGNVTGRSFCAAQSLCGAKGGGAAAPAAESFGGRKRHAAGRAR